MSRGLLDTRAFLTRQDAAEYFGSVVDPSTEYSTIATDPDGIAVWNLRGHGP